MSWISIVLWVLMHAPELIALVKQIIDLFKTMPKEDQAKAKADLFQAIQTKDKDQVKGVFRKWKHKCEGVACPPDLV